ncbi:MAG: rod shape-determining protein MreD [Gemmatimonadota bacterium]
MRILDWVVAGLLVLLHLVIHVGFGVGAAAPDLFTLALLVVARECHMALAAGLGWTLGLLEDAQGLLAFGAHGLALAIVGALAARSRELFVGDSLLFVASYLFLGKWLRDFVYWVAVGSGFRPPPVEALVVDAGLAALYMTLVGLAVVFVTGVLQGPRGVGS